MVDDTLTTDRRQFLKAGMAAAGLAGLGGLMPGQAPAANPADASLQGKPNILLIMVDEQRYPMSYESPELADFRKHYLKTQEALRQTGVECHRHYAASVACVPSRTSFFTGHYPSLHGASNTDGTAKSAYDAEMFWLTPHSVPTIGNYFRTAGYRTFYRGKWHVAHADLVVPGTRQSIVSYDDQGNRDPAAEARYQAANRLEDFGFAGWMGPEPHGSDPLNSGSSARGKKGRDEAIAGQTIDLLDELEASSDATPWLTVCSLVNPHDSALFGFFTRQNADEQGKWDFSVDDTVPYHLFSAEFEASRQDDLKQKPTCQESYRHQYSAILQPVATSDQYYRLYYQLHKAVDEQIARVYDRLKNSRFFANTIVVFTADHGDLLGAHGGLHQKWFTAYEEALRVPLIFSSPAWSQTGMDHLTSHVDVLPTLLGLAGLDAEILRQQLAGDFTDARPLVGKDISAAILGQAVPETLKTPIYFMTDDDPSRGPSQENVVGLSYSSVVQPNHIETVVVRRSDGLWKYSRYFDNPQYWSSPGTPVEPVPSDLCKLGGHDVQDKVVREINNKDCVGSQWALAQKTVKVTPAAEQYELYDLSNDPLEVVNLAGQRAVAAIEAELRQLLAEQCVAKRLSPVSGAVPGQPTFA